MNKRILFITILMIFMLNGCMNIPNETKDISQENDMPKSRLTITEILESVDISNLKSISILKDQNVEFQKFYNATSEHSINNIFSVTKSITSILMGIAIDEGYIESVDDSIDQYIDFEKYGFDESFKEITLHDLLIMSSGILWNSYDQSSEYFNLKASKEPLKMIFDRGISYKPASQFNYSDGSAYTVAAIIQEATGVTLLEYAEEKLFKPLGITDYKWISSSTGVNYGGFDLYLTCEGMQKIGLLVLNKGYYNSEQIVSENWLKTATTAKISTGGGSFNNHYGYYFWLGVIDNHKIISALGHGGQFITIVPDLELVITAGTTGAVIDELANKQFADLENLIKESIIPYYLED